MSMILATAALTGADLYLKEKADRETSLSDRKFPGDILRFRKHHNKGFALNKMEESPETVRKITFGATVVVAICWLVLLFKRGHFLEKLAAVFIFAGALSNLSDRIRKGYVVDYISIKKCRNERIRSLVFNLADLYVAIGAILGITAEIF